MPKHTFKSWYYTLRTCYGLMIALDSAIMYYNGGYSPKMVYAEVNKLSPAAEVEYKHNDGIVIKNF